MVGEDLLNRRSLFVRAVDEQTPVDVAAQFIEWGFQHLDVSVKDPRRAARLLCDREWRATIERRRRPPSTSGAGSDGSRA